MLGLRFVRGLSPVAASGGHSSSRCGDRSSSRCAGLSLSRPLPLRGTGSRRARNSVFTVRIPTTYEAFPCTRCCAWAFLSHQCSGLTADAAACCAEHPETRLSSHPREAPEWSTVIPVCTDGETEAPKPPPGSRGTRSGSKGGGP